MDFIQLLGMSQKERPGSHDHANKRILCLDPGHTTGWALFEKAALRHWGEIDTTSIPACVSHASHLFIAYSPEIVVMEDYRIYKWRQKQHVGSEMLTTRVIGCLETLAVQNFITDIIKQPAHVAKGFCTAAKLKEWDMYKPGMKHCRDAIRHGCYFMLFGAIRPEDKHS